MGGISEKCEVSGFSILGMKKGKVIDTPVYTYDKSPVGKRCSIKFRRNEEIAGNRVG